MVTVVAFVAVECLAGGLRTLGRRRGILGWRGLVVVVLVAETAEPAALVVLRLLSLHVVVAALSWHPASSIHWCQALATAAFVLDARAGDEEHDEQDDDDGGQYPPSVVAPA